MDIFVARQAIFDRNLRVYGYELLFRSCLDSAFDGSDGALASSRVIASSFFSIGIDRLLGGKRAFINFPRELLLDERASMLPPRLAVIEILESVEADAPVIAACRKLKKRGYLLALDDFVPREGDDALTSLADIIKVDFRATDEAGQRRLIEVYGPRGIRMLGEKIESREEFEQARKMGYVYFQGHFFARPVIVSAREIPGFKLNYLRILYEIQQSEVEFARLEELLKREVSLAYKLLRYVNSAGFGFARRIESLRQAMALLGETEIRKWASLVVLPELALDKPSELVVTAVIRAHFCESIARWVGLASRKSELFLMGLFSVLDAMMDRPLAEVLAGLDLAADVRAALLGEELPNSRLADVYRLIRAYETAQWQTLAATADRLGVDRQVIGDAYLESVDWTDQVFQAELVC